MAFQLIERPHLYVFSGNPVRYVFNITNPNTPGCAMEVALYIKDGMLPVGASNEKLILQQRLTPNPDGSVYFYCDDYLNSNLDWQMPQLGNDDVVAVTSQIKRFYIKYRQISTSNPSPDWVTTEINNNRYVIKGGVAKEKFDRNNFFVNYLPAKKPFLTWLPDKHFVGLDERRYLTYLYWNFVRPGHLEPLLLPTLKLKARAVWTDSTQETVTKDFPPLQDSFLFHCPAGLKQLGLDVLHADKKLWYYDVSVEDTDGNVMAEAYRMYVDYNQYYHVFSFVYHNSISGIDTLRVRGDWDTDINLNATDIQQATGGDFSGEVLPTENASVNISSYKAFDGDAGWMNTKKMQEALEDFLLSDGVYIALFSKRWLRVVNLQKNQKIGATNDTKWSFPIKWRYTFDNNFYTPFDTDLGAGVNNEDPEAVFGSCTAPSNVDRELTDDQPDEQTWHLTWDEVLGAIGYQVEVTDPNGNGTVEDVTDPEFDLVLDEQGDYTWRVRTKCDENDYSGYALGPGITVAFAATLCAAPGTLAIIILSFNGNDANVKFTWSAVPGVYGYWVEWREVGAAVWNSGFQFANNRTVTLQKDVQYEWRVRSQCDSSSVLHASGYKYGNAFIPSNLVGTCNAPTDPAAYMLTFSIMRQLMTMGFQWTNAANTTDYELQIREVGQPNWGSVNNIQSGFSTMLPMHRTWEWRVRSNCNAGGMSAFTNGANFDT